MAPFPVEILRHTMESGGILKNGKMDNRKALFIVYVMYALLSEETRCPLSYQIPAYTVVQFGSD